MKTISSEILILLIGFFSLSACEENNELTPSHVKLTEEENLILNEMKLSLKNLISFQDSLELFSTDSSNNHFERYYHENINTFLNLHESYEHNHPFDDHHHDDHGVVHKTGSSRIGDTTNRHFMRDHDAIEHLNAHHEMIK